MTEVSPPDVILLRSAEDPDPYVHALADVGFRGVCQPVLDFNFPADEILLDRLQHPAEYGGVIATSPRAAWALRRVFDTSGTLHAEWEGMPVYVAGPKTADRFRDLGFDVHGADTGSAEELLSLLTDAEPSSSLLFLAGNRRREVLPDGLQDAGISFEEEIVYETHPRADLTLPPSDGETWLVFYSPSGLEALYASEITNVSEYLIAAIGPTTAAELHDAGLEVDAVASVPSPEGVVDAVVGAAGSAV
ncbi:MAG: uroporphyrinogen-III synthase [Bacteroidetes bacterium SW_9_63_38]|nr:MAG: uroporphyrinogen-III synthase [Bacteroidetes bacterium SW_9_63_38]